MTKLCLLANFMVFVSFASAIEKLNVTVYYESLCPYSTEFIKEQLWPAYKIIGDQLVVDLVPHGHANLVLSESEGIYRYKCQHGKWECFGNKVQTCVTTFDIDAKDQLGFMQCVQGEKDPDVYETCAKDWNVDSTKIASCYDGKEDVQKENDERTKEVIPSLSTVVPFVIFNDQYVENLSGLARKNFLQTACRLFTEKPTGCEE